MKTNPAPAIVPCIPFERASGVPYYRQIYEGYRSAILSGTLRPGQRLPSTRSLAVELKISRLPVLNAFEQLLHEGYIEGKPGSGTYVTESIPDELAKPVVVKPALLAEARSALKRLPADWVRVPDPDGIIGPFRVSLPALDQFPHKIWSRLVARRARSASAKDMAYGDSAGYGPLRAAIARYTRAARAVVCDDGQVVVVSGSQMALQLAARALLARGDVACMEEPGYPGARFAFLARGARLSPTPVDQNGLDVRRITARGNHARLVYLTPSHQYPLGVSMTAARRLELLDWAQQNQSWIVEDDYDSEYRFTSRPLGALQGVDTAGRVIYIGTFSKVIFPSLRLGYVILPHELVDRFVRLRESLDLSSPTLYQQVVTDFLEEGHFNRHLRRMRAIYEARRDALLEAIRHYLYDLLRPVNSDAGLHLAAFLPVGSNDLEITTRAAERGISVLPLSTCYAGPRPRSGLILGFGGADEPQMMRAARQLAEVIKSTVGKSRLTKLDMNSF